MHRLPLTAKTRAEESIALVERHHLSEVDCVAVAEQHSWPHRLPAPLVRDIRRHDLIRVRVAALMARGGEPEDFALQLLWQVPADRSQSMLLVGLHSHTATSTLVLRSATGS